MKSRILMLILFTLISSVAVSSAELHLDVKAIKAKRIADEITDLRSHRAAQLLNSDLEISPEIFKKTCGAVKKRAMEIVKTEGVKIKHAAIKNRNPKHAATPEEAKMHEYFDNNRDVSEIINEKIRDGRKYYSYIRPIFIETACLKCHGKKSNRPEFIKKGYPEDKAFGFQVGDLRGIIEVMVPID
ncbi:MAG: DUF3365 domain-containing protein [Proteobacteria bacterium]|nr:DUF3365 domain-containing protein [Pseudomonadota bacterium]